MRVLIVGGTGGSGTRAVAHYLRAAGLYIGTDLNESLDAMPFARLLSQFIEPRLLSKATDMAAFSSDEFKQAWLEAARLHLSGFGGDQIWCAKNPRSILLLDLLYELFPEISFLHVVRDGVDMAFSDNQRQLVLHGDSILGQNIEEESTPSRSLKLWALLNQQASDLGQAYPGRYAQLRYEDFCKDPQSQMARLSEVLSLPLRHDQVDPGTYVRSTRVAPVAMSEEVQSTIRLIAPVRELFGYPC